MKEAAGEANLTVITIILIGVVVAIAIPLVNNLMKNAEKRACCTDAGGVWSSSGCTSGGGDNIYDSSSYNACISETETPTETPDN